MDFLSFVTQARTCRRFHEEKPLESADLDWLIDCARVTPSARNAQQLRFIEVLGKTCKELFPLTHWAMALKDWGGPAEGERPTAFLGLLIPKNPAPTTYIDCGICAQTIQLAAHSRGYGCCIIKSFEQNQAQSLLQVPSDLQLELLLGLGVASEERKVVDVPESGSLNYFRDANNVHYVPKRAREELIIARFVD
ncbi:MAG: nitroreductase family protein [Desulfovibrionaceae bacterium]|nr:nitroreductase family protein [Desulfovibrionaceae bacterium]